MTLLFLILENWSHSYSNFNSGATTTVPTSDIAIIFLPLELEIGSLLQLIGGMEASWAVGCPIVLLYLSRLTAANGRGPSNVIICLIRRDIQHRSHCNYNNDLIKFIFYEN
jgi:hypothetical protein